MRRRMKTIAESQDRRFEVEPHVDTKANVIKNMGPNACQICGDQVGKTVEGEPFVACDVCTFPVCRPCYEYEREDGNQSYPQCKSRYKRHKGSPAVLGDEEVAELDNDDDDELI